MGRRKKSKAMWCKFHSFFFLCMGVRVWVFSFYSDFTYTHNYTHSYVFETCEIQLHIPGAFWLQCFLETATKFSVALPQPLRVRLQRQLSQVFNILGAFCSK